MILNMDYKPQVLVRTDGLSRDEWLEYRRRGIGGSDAAAVLGISPFRTGRDLFYDKLKIVTADDNENWVAKEAGRLLEPLVAQIFEYRTGLKVHRLPIMFQHPLYPWMLADLDFIVELPNRDTAILECKTCNYNAKDIWWSKGVEIVPEHYKSQGCHYLSVMNLPRVYFCCLYGNTADEAIIRHIDRDLSYEAELITMERNFWQNNVLAHVPPPYLEYNGDLVQESLKHAIDSADKSAPPVLLEQVQAAQALAYLDLQQKKSALSAEVRKLENEMKRLKGQIVDKMGASCTAIFSGEDINYRVTYNPSYSTDIPKENLERLKEQYPEVYDKFVVVSEHRRFYVKKDAKQAA